MENMETLEAQLNDALQKLRRIQPIYEKLYHNPLYWFVRPHDAEIEGKVLFRCKTCNGLFWKDGPREFTAHKGHQYSPARETSVWEYFKMRLGMIK